jgi:hypothetical protein
MDTDDRVRESVELLLADAPVEAATFDDDDDALSAATPPHSAVYVDGIAVAPTRERLSSLARSVSTNGGPASMSRRQEPDGNSSSNASTGSIRRRSTNQGRRSTSIHSEELVARGLLDTALAAPSTESFAIGNAAIIGTFISSGFAQGIMRAPIKYYLVNSLRATGSQISIVFGAFRSFGSHESLIPLTSCMHFVPTHIISSCLNSLHTF